MIQFEGIFLHDLPKKFRQYFVQMFFDETQIKGESKFYFLHQMGYERMQRKIRMNLLVRTIPKEIKLFKCNSIHSSALRVEIKQSVSSEEF